MKEFVFSSALGLNLSPFASSKKESATAAAIGIGAGIGTLAANVYSSYKNLQSQADTNAANKEINREQLAAQRYLYDQQRADERFLVNQAYERNLPKNQVKNLREAGINPAFAMENGSFGVQQAQSGSAPSAPSVGSPIPMQRSDYSGFGVAASQAANLIAQGLQTDKENDRADYALASDITVNHLNARSNYIRAIADAKNAGVNEKYLKSQMEDSERRYWLDVDKNAVDKEDRAKQREIEERANDIRRYEAETARALADSKIKVDSAQINLIAQQVAECKENVKQMAANGESQRKINDEVERYQSNAADIVMRKNRREARQNGSEVRRLILDALDFVFTPIKGIISVNMK